ncbi:MAG: PDZ domain-containing protein [Woeseiaceae bacterium]|nr:PDZ domain-containing protein [Woeseiaceae bacterium]
MKALIVAIPLSLVAGIAIGSGLGGEESSGTAGETVAYIDSTAPIEERLAALERIISEERNARLVLEDQLNMIYEELDQYDEEIPRGGPAGEESAEVAVAQAGMAAIMGDSSQEFGSREEYLLNQLVEGGFSQDRADWIVERSAEFQWEAMQGRYEARQNGERFDWAELDPTTRLRAEIGDAEYERYLEATGQPSIVSVQSVMATSPAERVGLQPGDEIRSYGGQRIFNVRDLQIATNSAAPGTNVVVEVMRNGSPVTVSMPAGPLGIQAGSSSGVPGWRRSN